MSDGRLSKAARGILLAVVSTSSVIYCAAHESATGTAPPNSGLYVKVRLDHPLKMSKLKPGDVVQGKLARNVYSAERELFPAETSVSLTVDHMEQRRRTTDDHWPGVVKLFAPRREKFPVFKIAVVVGASGESALPVSFVSVSRRREVHAQARGKESGNHKDESRALEVSKAGGLYGPRNPARQIMVLEAFGTETEDEKAPSAKEDVAPALRDQSVPGTLPAGTACKILLLGDLTASRSKAGDTVQARLLEPVFSNSQLALPAGTVFEGKVVKQTSPRWGSRAGSLFLTFTGLTLPGGNFIPIAASLAGAELDRGSHTRIDAEGQLRGERPGKAWMAINFGVTAGIAKGVDDAAQLIVEALISTATDVSTAGTARIVSSVVSGIYMVTRHGRDVVLPRFTEMNIVLDRPLTVTRNAESSASAAVVHGN
jgi:hypothetical protein